MIIHEPNGNNPGLKIIEKTSRYHIGHHEKSYGTRQMKRWLGAAGAAVAYSKTAGFVPMFCPDWLARAMKVIEPAVEGTPVFRSLACAVHVMVGVRA